MTPNRRPRLGPQLTLLAGLLIGPARAGEAPLQVPADTPAGSHVSLTVPLAVRGLLRGPEMADLQVLNAKGETLPYAWADAWAAGDPGAAAPAPSESAVPYFQAPAAASAALPEQSGGWIIDARALAGRLVALQLQLPAGTQGVYSLALEHSRDLQQWQPLRDSLQLLSLQHQGQWLQNTRIELGEAAPGYLRLRPLPGSALPPLSGVRVTSVPTPSWPTPALQWSDAIAPAQCDARYCDYPLPHQFPLARLELLLTQPGVLAQLQLSVQDAPPAGLAAPSAERHRLRDQLKGLHDKSAPAAHAAPQEAPWQPLLSTTAYWLQRPEGELRAASFAGDGRAHLRLRLAPAGGMAQLGSTPPQLRVGAPARSLVFLARAPGPFRLAWGGADAQALPLPVLMPGWRPGQALPAANASVQLPLAAAAAPTAPAAAASPPAAPAPERHQLWLWAALLAALGLMGGMAWSLLKPGTRPTAGADTDPPIKR